MRESVPVTFISVDIDAGGIIDPDELELLGLELREELRGAGAVSVQPADGGPAPTGTRGIDGPTVGALIVGVITTAAALSQLIETAAEWSRRPGRRPGVRVTIDGHEVPLSADDRKRLVELLQETAQDE